MNPPFDISLTIPKMLRKTNNQEGFSLVELLIVVLIIGIVATIAIPNMLAARRSANEGTAISSLRSLHSAQSTYFTSRGAGNYAGINSVNGDASGLNILLSVGLVDTVLGSGIKSGYNFVGGVTVAGSGTPATFFFSANPVTAVGISQTGTRRYCITQQGFLGYDIANISTPFTGLTVQSSIPFN